MFKKIVFTLLILLLPTTIQAEILFSQNFDDDTTGSYLLSDAQDDWSTSFLQYMWFQISNADIVDGADAYGGAGKSLRITYPSGCTAGGGCGAQWRCYIDGADEYWYSFRLKFHADWMDPDPPDVQNGKLTGLCGGTCESGGGEIPDGTDGWSGRMVFNDDPSYIREYVYHVDQPTQYGDGTDWDVGGLVYADPGNWHHYEIQYVMNTVDVANGIIRGYVDGVLRFERTDYKFLTSGGTFSIDNYFFSTFFGGSGSTYAPKKDEYTYWDDIVISTTKSFMKIQDASPTGTGIGLDTDLNWTNPTGATGINLYFDVKATHNPPTTLVIDDSLETTYEPGTLPINTTYVYRADVVHAGGTETGTVYEFTTTGGPPTKPTGLATCSYNSLGLTGSDDDQGATVGE